MAAKQRHRQLPLLPLLAAAVAWSLLCAAAAVGTGTGTGTGTLGLRHKPARQHNSTRHGGGRRAQRGGAPGTGMASCNLFQGSWVYDDTLPMYDAAGCPFVEPEFDCQKYGRPDKLYLKYRWRPASCELPRYAVLASIYRIESNLGAPGAKRPGRAARCAVQAVLELITARPPSLLPTRQVQRAGLAEPVEGEEDTVRGGLHQPEPVGVACVHAARGRAGVLQGRLRQGQPRLQRHVPGAYAPLPCRARAPACAMLVPVYHSFRF